MRLLDRLSAIWHSPEAITELEGIIMANATDYAARLDAVSNEIAGELTDLRSQLAGSNDSWAAALDGPIARLENLGKSDQDPEPVGTDPTAGTPESSGDSSF